MKFIKTTKVEKANGSSYHGITIKSTLTDLVKVFGKPSALESEDNKVTHNLGWWSETDGRKDVEDYLNVNHIQLKEYEDIEIVERY